MIYDAVITGYSMFNIPRNQICESSERTENL